MDGEQVDRLLGQVRRDTGGAFVTGLAYIGDRLGLFAALGKHGPVTSTQLAEATDTQERYVREWLKAVAAFEYVEHDPATAMWWLTEEQRAVLVDEEAAVFGAGTFQFAVRSLGHTDELIEAFRHGGGISYAQLHPEIAPSIDRMHRAWFDHLLTGSWLPAIPGLTERLAGGLKVLDIGCGLGRSTAALASAYPKSCIVGLEPHPPSVAAAREMNAGLDNAVIVQATLDDLAASDTRAPATFGLILAIDCIHDMVDPVGALSTIRGLLDAEGLFVWSEMTGSTNPLENRSDSLARVRAALSPYHCLTVSLAEGGAGLGTILGEEGARELALAAGYDGFEILPVDSPVQAFYGLRR